VVADLRAGRAVVGQEYLFRAKSGNVITGLFSAQAIQLNQGPCILAVINDITDRKQAEEVLRQGLAKVEASRRTLLSVVEDQKRTEEALRESEVRYRTLFDGSADGILIADIETKIFKYANPALCRMLGYNVDELRTMGVPDIVPKDAVQSVIAEF